MKRQLIALPYELWLGGKVCILTTDIISPATHKRLEKKAFLEGNDVHFLFGSRVYIFRDIPLFAVSTIHLGFSAIVEFGPQGPIRETPILIRDSISSLAS